MNRRGVVVFDLDGTLLDTLEDLRSALSAVLAEDRRPPVSSADARAMVGGGARNLLALAWERTGAPLEPTRVEAVYQAFLAHYQAVLLATTRPFPGAEAALDALSPRHALAIATNKPEAPTRDILAGLGLLGRFQAVVGGDTLRVKKPDPAVIAAARAGSPGPAVLVGDSATDVRTARNAGIPVILARWGYPGPDGPPPVADAAIDSFAELPAAVARLIG